MSLMALVAKGLVTIARCVKHLTSVVFQDLAQTWWKEKSIINDIKEYQLSLGGMLVHRRVTPYHQPLPSSPSHPHQCLMQHVLNGTVRVMCLVQRTQHWLEPRVQCSNQ